MRITRWRISSEKRGKVSYAKALFLICCLPVLLFAQSPCKVNYPQSLDDSSSLCRGQDAPQSTLTGALNATDDTFTVADGLAFPDSNVLLIIDTEVLSCTSRSGNTFAGCLRGQSDTAAANHASDSLVRLSVLPITHNILAAAVSETEKKLGAGESNAESAKTGDCLQKQDDGTTKWVSCAASGVNHTGPVTISANSDATADGSISFKTGGVERVVIASDGKVGFGTDTPNAKLDFNTLPATPNTGATIMRFRTNEINSADFVFDFTTFSNAWGQPRRNNVFSWGYNVHNALPGEPSFQQTIESRYRTSQGIDQTEFYIAAQAAGQSTRPLSIDLYHPTGNTQLGISAHSFFFANPSQSNVWMRGSSSDVSGQMSFTNNSRIDLAGSINDWPLFPFISKRVAGNAASRYGAHQMFSNASEANFFPFLGTGVQNMYLTVGGSQGAWAGLRWNSTLGRWEYSNAGGTVWRAFNSEFPAGYSTAQVTSPLPGALNSYTEIGDLKIVGGTASFEIETFDQYPQQSKHFIVTTNYEDAGAGWVELLPISQSGPRNSVPDAYAVDMSVAGDKKSIRLRLRRTVAGSNNQITVMLKMPGLNNGDWGFTSLAGTGSDATVGGIFRGTPWTAYGGRMVVGKSTTTPAAILDLTATDKGFLPPRMTQAQRDAISSPPNGLMIYNTTTNKINVRSAGVWRALAYE